MLRLHPEGLLLHIFHIQEQLIVGVLTFLEQNCLPLLGTLAKLQKVTKVMSVCLSSRNNSVPTVWIVMKFDICIFFENMSRKFKFHENLTRIMGTLQENEHTFMIISHSVFFRIRNAADKSCRENQNMHFMFSNFLLLLKIMLFVR
jgi:hypothetical protein